MQISSYFNLLRKAITASPFISSWYCEEDARTSTEGFFKAHITFEDGSRLEFREYINTFVRPYKKYAYSYHYYKKDQFIFRHDNTPHYPELPGFPHHKHIASKVIECSEPSLRTVLREIESILMAS